MSTYIQNYGFNKTLINENGHKIKKEINWIGDYDGNNANLEMDINNNGKKQSINMKLDNNDLMELLGVQPVEMSLDKRLANDFLYKPTTLEGALKKSRKHKTRHHKHRHTKRRRSHKNRHL
jgi:hypothetical protein